MTQAPTIHGKFDERFAPVREEFERNFTERKDVGASVAVSLDGEYVVDLWAGHRDAAKTLPWEEDTIVNVYSTTKTMAALVFLMLADQGELDLDAPVGKYWPQYACNGKEKTLVKHFLSHSAGLSGMDRPCSGADLYDWDAVCASLAAQKPWWEPGTQSGYHALTQGYLIGEVVRRITGQTLGQFFRTQVAEPLEADFHIGTPKQHFPRIAELIPPKAAPLGDLPIDSIAARTFASPAVDVADTPSDGWRMAEIPAANGHGNARAVVRVQTAVANGGSAWGKRLLSEAGARRVLEEQTYGPDLVLGLPIRFGMGYGMTSTEVPMGPNPNTAFWGGYGGSSIVVDFDARLCVSYTMNYMESEILGDPRGFGLLAAAYQSIAAS